MCRSALSRSAASAVAVVRERAAVPALELVIVDARRERRQRRALRPHQPLVLVERVVGGADGHRRERHREDGHPAPGIHRVAVEPVPRCPAETSMSIMFAHEAPASPGCGCDRSGCCAIPSPLSRACRPSRRASPHSARGATNSKELRRRGGILGRQQRLGHVVRRVGRCPTRTRPDRRSPSRSRRASRSTGAATESRGSRGRRRSGPSPPAATRIRPSARGSSSGPGTTPSRRKPRAISCTTRMYVGTSNS